jgi:hypothetical protein
MEMLVVQRLGNPHHIHQVAVEVLEVLEVMEIQVHNQEDLVVLDYKHHHHLEIHHQQ